MSCCHLAERRANHEQFAMSSPRFPEGSQGSSRPNCLKGRGASEPWEFPRRSSWSEEDPHHAYIIALGIWCGRRYSPLHVYVHRSSAWVESRSGTSEFVAGDVPRRGAATRMGLCIVQSSVSNALPVLPGPLHRITRVSMWYGSPGGLIAWPRRGRRREMGGASSLLAVVGQTMAASRWSAIGRPGLDPVCIKSRSLVIDLVARSAYRFTMEMF
jgi:hypothetical protein